MTIQEGIAWSGGCELEYQRHSGSSPTIVMLHEGLGSVSTWREFPAELAAATSREVVVYSRYGYGRSAVRETPFDVEYMHRAALDELPEFLASLGIQNPILFGHSDGASIALIYAGAHPDDVRGVIVEAPHVFTEDISVRSIAEIQKIYEASGDLRKRLARHHKDPDATFYGWNSVWQLADFEHWNIEEYLPSIQCPTLVIQGAGDEYGTMAQVDRIQSGSGGAVTSLILEECGHAPHRDQSAAVLAASVEFLAGL